MSIVAGVDILEWLNSKCEETRFSDSEAYDHYNFVRDELFKSVFRKGREDGNQ